MKLTTSLLAAFCLSACAAQEEDGSTAIESRTEAVSLAPMCGDGAFEYYEWKCDHSLGIYVPEMVGERAWSCVFPFDRGMTGHTTSWIVRNLSACGDTEAECYVPGDPPPKPTATCLRIYYPPVDPPVRH